MFVGFKQHLETNVGVKQVCCDCFLIFDLLTFFSFTEESLRIVSGGSNRLNHIESTSISLFHLPVYEPIKINVRSPR